MFFLRKPQKKSWIIWVFVSEIAIKKRKKKLELLQGAPIGFSVQRTLINFQFYIWNMQKDEGWRGNCLPNKLSAAGIRSRFILKFIFRSQSGWCLLYWDVPGKFYENVFCILLWQTNEFILGDQEKGNKKIPVNLLNFFPFVSDCINFSEIFIFSKINS